jgi:hypothetical protein
MAAISHQPSSHLFTSWLSSDRIKVKVTLRLTVNQSVSLGSEPHLGIMTKYLLLFNSYRLVFVGRVCLLYMLLTLSSAVFLGSESLGTRDHILLSPIWDFPFVASYDSQGHGAGIRPRLHTGPDWQDGLNFLRYNPDVRTRKKTPFATVTLLL